MIIFNLILFVFFIGSGCDRNSENESSINKKDESSFISHNRKIVDEKNKIDPTGEDILTRIKTPEGYKRIGIVEGSFGDYLRHFPLKEDGVKVYYFDGTEKEISDIHVAVLDIDAGDKDLQQCADAIMRLRAEYLYEKKDYKNIHYNFTNGFSADYDKWAEGYRIKVRGNKSKWYLSAGEDYSYNTFREYLEIVFTYAGTLSLSKELKSITEEELNIGDIFIQGGSPGHAVLVTDVAINENNEKIFLLAQSYMPAQDIHILKNPENIDLSPWYSLDDTEMLYTPEWTFEKSDLKRFDN